MNMLLLGLILFIGVHAVSIVAPSWRDRMAARLGERKWKAIYSVVALVGFVLIVIGYGDARQMTAVLYVPRVEMRYLAAGLMLPVFPLLFASHLPGKIKSGTKHPMLLATILWAIAHLLANGTRADVLLFGSFLVWAIADRMSVATRPPRPIRMAPARRANDAIAIVAGLVVYAAFVLWLHRWLFGVPILV